MASLLNARRASPYKADFEKNVVYVYQFPRPNCVPSISPFCVKLETWLRIAGIKYENVDCPAWIRSSEGMLPFVELNGEEVADSGFVISHLLRRFPDRSTEKDLSPSERAAGRALEALVENSALPSYGRIRYQEKAQELMSERVMGARMWAQIPALYRMVAPRMMARGAKKNLAGHGIGRHSLEEAVEIGVGDLEALQDFLGDKDFLLGAKATRVDATAFGVLSQLLWVPIQTPQGDHMKEKLPKLVEYTERIKERFWPDWDEACDTGSLHTYKPSPAS